MIYIITPLLSDLARTCEKENIKCDIQNGRIINNYEVRWVYELTQLRGIKISPTDKMVLGSMCEFLPEGVFNMIIREIEFRKYIGKQEDLKL
jgi:hypothetical protein